MSQMIRRTVPVGTRIVISYAMERASVVNLIKSQWKLIQQHDQNFAMEESHSEQILVLEGINKSKRAGL